METKVRSSNIFRSLSDLSPGDGQLEILRAGQSHGHCRALRDGAKVGAMARKIGWNFMRNDDFPPWTDVKMLTWGILKYIKSSFSIILNCRGKNLICVSGVIAHQLLSSISGRFCGSFFFFSIWKYGGSPGRIWRIWSCQSCRFSNVLWVNGLHGAFHSHGDTGIPQKWMAYLMENPSINGW